MQWKEGDWLHTELKGRDAEVDYTQLEHRAQKAASLSMEMIHG